MIYYCIRLSYKISNIIVNIYYLLSIEYHTTYKPDRPINDVSDFRSIRFRSEIVGQTDIVSKLYDTIINNTKNVGLMILYNTCAILTLSILHCTSKTDRSSIAS